jgi:hypothetical protein
MTAGVTPDPAAKMWPVIVAHDRYHGVYTGGEWVAIPNADRVPLEHTVWGDDEDCFEWAAAQLAAGRLGVGATPQQAYDDLLTRHAAVQALDRQTAGLLLDRLEAAGAGETVTLDELAHELGVYLDRLDPGQVERFDD